jgi:hypothetical protein
MASASQSVAVRPASRVSRILGRGGLVDRYFYLFLSLVMAGIVVAGFNRTVDHFLIHATPPRPMLLWIHGAAFSAWVVLFIVQSALVRVRKVRLHRTLGWFGAALGAMMVTLGVLIAVVMGRFNALQLHQANPSFLSIQFFDMLSFGTLFGLAILWRGKPELHRRFLVLATCGLVAAAFARFDFVFYHNLFYVCVDAVMLLGVARDLVVDRRVNKVYLYGIPALVVGQNLAIYLWQHPPGWWVSSCKEILGI